MSALVEFAIFPTDKGESKSQFVARVLEIVKDSGLNYQLTPMGTIIEGKSVSEIFKVIERAYEELEQDCNRIYSVIKIDYRKGDIGRMDKKLNSVYEKMKS